MIDSVLTGLIFRFPLAGDEILVLNHPKDAEELLGRRSFNIPLVPLLFTRGIINLGASGLGFFPTETI
ncbi:hypothetical protein PM082_007336 [Marasmius tenuissimus]|nr:hypothetical protein PM082_007336 [Marasmius tenuissimus]